LWVGLLFLRVVVRVLVWVIRGVSVLVSGV